MLEGIPADLLLQGGAATILAMAVLAIIRGILVPRTLLDKLLTLHAERLAEASERADEWKQIATTAMAAGAEKDRQLETLLEVGRTTNALLEGIKRASSGERPI